MTEQNTENQGSIPTPSPPLRKRMERAAGRVLIRLLVGPLRAMPLSFVRPVGRAMGMIMFHSLGRYRRVALKNLALVYGKEFDRAERTRMAHDVFRHFGQMAAEFVKLPALSREAVDRLATVDGEQNLKRALEFGHGVLLITGHLGNWEFMARWLTTHGYALNVVARDTRDPEATKLLTDTREGSGAQVLYRGNSARALLKCLRKNEIVAILPDQNAADVFVPFLGQRTGTVDGPAIIHLKTGAPLLFSWCIRTAENKFHITFEPPESIESTGDRVSDICSVMTLVNARLEAQIRRNPTQWLWLHNRWKASPGIFPEGEENARDLNTPYNKYRVRTEDSNDNSGR